MNVNLRIAVTPLKLLFSRLQLAEVCCQSHQADLRVSSVTAFARATPALWHLRPDESQLPGSANLPSGPTQVCVCRHQKLPVFDGGTVSSFSAQMNIPFQRRFAQRLGR